MGLGAARGGTPERQQRRWRLVFDPPVGPPIVVGKRDPGGVDAAMTAIRSRLRAAMEAGGCRSFVVGVHVEGEACDHEV